jgi:hypothetical protein
MLSLWRIRSYPDQLWGVGAFYPQVSLPAILSTLPFLLYINQYPLTSFSTGPSQLATTCVRVVVATCVSFSCFHSALFLFLAVRQAWWKHLSMPIRKCYYYNRTGHQLKSCPEYLSEAILAEWPVLLICQRKSPDQFLWHESDLALISTDHPIFERRSANPAGGRGLVAGLRGKSEIPMNYEKIALSRKPGNPDHRSDTSG